MEKINLFGASGHGKVIMDIIRANGDEVGCFYDDMPKGEMAGVRVVETGSSAVDAPVIVSIGDNMARKRVVSRLNVEFASAVHPAAVVSPSSKISEGTVVMQGAIVQADAQIGRHCIINTGASVDHDCRIGDFVHISPHATLCGNVEVGEGTWIGAGAVVIQGIRIGKWSVIGAGSVVVKDIPDGVVASGNPCRERHAAEVHE